MRVILLVFVLARIGQALAQQSPAVAGDPTRLVLPRDLCAVVGHETSVYFDNIILTGQPGALLFDVTCARGRQDQDRWRFVPTEADVGDHAFSITVLDGMNRVLSRGTATVHVIPATAGAGRTVSLLCVGDSLTHASVYPEELWRLCQGEGQPFLKLVGTHHPIAGQPPEVVHEGYGGWSWATFCTRWTEGDDPGARSPFLRLEDGRPVLDFRSYCERANAGSAPDFITVFLGCNDNFGATDETIEASIDNMMHYAEMLLTEFRRVGPQTQIGILTLTPPAQSQDAFGNNYGCGQTRWQYRRNQHRVVERMMQAFGGREAENLFVIPAHVNLDTAHNYPTVSEPVNLRNPVLVSRQSNGVHPSRAGYLQIADSIYCWLKWRLAQ